MHVNGDSETRVWQHGGNAPYRSPDPRHPGALRADSSGISVRGRSTGKREARSRNGAHAVRVHARVPRAAHASQPVERQGELKLRPQQEGRFPSTTLNEMNAIYTSGIINIMSIKKGLKVCLCHFKLHSTGCASTCCSCCMIKYYYLIISWTWAGIKIDKERYFLYIVI